MREKLIYVVDDEKDIREMESTFLENEGYKVETFASADDLIEIFMPKNNAVTGTVSVDVKYPDLIVMDIMMTGMDGLTACSRLRKSEIAMLQTVPIILVSAKDTPLDRVTGLTMGSDDYLVKPFLPLELVARVKALLRRSEMLTNHLQNDTDGILQINNALGKGASTESNTLGDNNTRSIGKKIYNCGNLVLDYAAHKVYIDLALSNNHNSTFRQDINIDKDDKENTDINDIREKNSLKIVKKSTDLKGKEKIEIQVTPMEFDFLYYLILRKETAVSKSELLSNIWQLPDAELQEDVRMTDDLVKRLRKKLTGSNTSARIETVWGFGYRLTEN